MSLIHTARFQPIHVIYLLAAITMIGCGGKIEGDGSGAGDGAVLADGGIVPECLNADGTCRTECVGYIVPYRIAEKCEEPQRPAYCRPDVAIPCSGKFIYCVVDQTDATRLFLAVCAPPPDPRYRMCTPEENRLLSEEVYATGMRCPVPGK